MITRKLKQIAVVNDVDPAQFQNKVNDVLMSKGEDVTEVKYYNETGSLISIISYNVEIEEIETADDYFEALGKHYICNDCPFCELDPDRRAKTHFCLQHTDRIRLDSPACEWFLQGLRDGKLHLVTPGERRKQYDRMDKEEKHRREEKLKLTRKQAYYDRKKRQITAERKKALPEPEKEV